MLEDGVFEELRPPGHLAHGTGHNGPADGQAEGQSAKDNKWNGTEMGFIARVAQENAYQNGDNGSVPVEVFLQFA